MAVETEFDNEGIKKGLQQINLQLNEANKKLAEQGKPNLFKAFKENQAEVFAAIAISRAEMEQERRLFEATPAGTGVVKIPKKGEKASAIPAEDDTLYGQMAKLVNIQTQAMTAQAEIKSEFEENRRINQERAKFQYETRVEENKNRIETLATMTDPKAVNIMEQQIAKTLKQIEEYQRENNIATKDDKEEEKKLKEKEQKSFSTMFGKGLFGDKAIPTFKGMFDSLNTGFSKLGGTLGKKLGGLTLKIGVGFKNLGKKFMDGLKKFFGGIGFALKTIGAILLIGGLYKFLSSDTWQKMKPNIAESIGNGLEMMDFAVRTLYGIITDYVIPMFKSLVNGLFSALDTLGLVRKDQRTYDAEDYDKKTAQMESNVTRMSEEGYDEQGTFEPDFVYNTRMKGKKMAIERLAKRKANRDENLQAIHENRKEKYVRQYMSFYSGSTRAEALAEYQEQHEGHILGIGPSSIGKVQDYANPAFTGGGGQNNVAVKHGDVISTNYGNKFTSQQQNSFHANLARIYGL